MNRILYISIITLGVLLPACSEDKSETKQAEVLAIKDIGQLSTTEYTIGKVIELKDNKEWYKFGDRNILISCKATVKAGVDLAQLGEANFKIDGDKISIDLPYPYIQSFDMNPEFIHTEMEDISGFRNPFTQEEKNEILRQGENSIRSSMNRTSILEEARKNADVFIRNFYRELGFEEITITFHKAHEQEIKSR